MTTPRFSFSTTFEPKEIGERRVVRLSENVSSGYDLALFIDSADNETEDSGWFLELGVEPDGMVCGQITAHPGYDALASFTCTQDRLIVEADSEAQRCVITPATVEVTSRELEHALRTLADAAHLVNARQHAGNPVPPSMWSDLYDATNKARAVLEG